MKNLYVLAFLTVVFGYATAVRDIRSETTCQTHKRNAGGANALMHWDVQCDSNGDYMPLQCTVETPKWCACYNKNESITQPSRRTKSCECFLARDAATKTSHNTCDVPACQNTGKFEKKQCCARTQKCHCVHPTTGQKTREPTSDMNIVCP